MLWLIKVKINPDFNIFHSDVIPDFSEEFFDFVSQEGFHIYKDGEGDYCQSFKIIQKVDFGSVDRKLINIVRVVYVGDIGKVLFDRQQLLLANG
jgi:hypothetical protein